MASAFEQSSVEEAPPDSFVPPSVLPALDAAREQIDSLDRELLDMFARRARLASVAATVKRRAGYEIRDLARERAMIEVRKSWGSELDLEPNLVEATFRAVLRLTAPRQKNAPDRGVISER